MKSKETTVIITPPNLSLARIKIQGTAPYVQNAFSQKAEDEIRAKQEAGSTARKGKKKEAKDFNACYEGALHRTADGWMGIPANGMRNAMISACRLVGFKMTMGKLGVFIVADGFDKNDGTPLIRITKGSPRRMDGYVRLATGTTDIRPRPMWDAGWEAEVTVKFDGDQFTLEDITNLLARVGEQVGVGEGRPDSKKSAGMGWGLFRVVTEG